MSIFNLQLESAQQADIQDSTCLEENDIVTPINVDVLEDLLLET